MKPIDRNELYGHVQKLPALSAVVTELLATIDEEEINIELIAKKISCDQVITIKTLRLANSSFYGVQHTISSVTEAINILGFKNLRMLIASSAITSVFSPVKIRNFNYASFWQHSIGTAICAKEIAATVGANHEVAFIAGLIHDIGKLALVTHYPKEYECALEYQIQNRCDLDFAERKLLGLDHSEVSEAVIQYWNFPAQIQNAVSQKYIDDDDPKYQLAGIIHLADAFAYALDFSNENSALVPAISSHVWNKMHLDEPSCHLLFGKSLKKFDELSQNLVS